MATQAELQQAAGQKQQQQRQLIRAVTGTVAQMGTKIAVNTAIKKGGQAAVEAKSFSAGSMIADVIDIAGALGIGLWQYLNQKSATKKTERTKKNQDFAKNETDKILDTIEETGNALIEQHSISPVTPEFDKEMYNNLFNTVGYLGNCNAKIWLPNSKPGPNRPVWFEVKMGGRIISPVSLIDPPPNFSTYWYTRCKNIKDSWINIYQQKLINEGRQAELRDLQNALNKGKWVIRGVFGLIFGILIIMMVRNSIRIK